MWHHSKGGGIHYREGFCRERLPRLRCCDRLSMRGCNFVQQPRLTSHQDCNEDGTLY